MPQPDRPDWFLANTYTFTPEELAAPQPSRRPIDSSRLAAIISTATCEIGRVYPDVDTLVIGAIIHATIDLYSLPPGHGTPTHPRSWVFPWQKLPWPDGMEPGIAYCRKPDLIPLATDGDE